MRNSIANSAATNSVNIFYAFDNAFRFYSCSPTSKSRKQNVSPTFFANEKLVHNKRTLSWSKN